MSHDFPILHAEGWRFCSPHSNDKLDIQIAKCTFTKSVHCRSEDRHTCAIPHWQWKLLRFIEAPWSMANYQRRSLDRLRRYHVNRLTNRWSRPRAAVIFSFL